MPRNAVQYLLNELRESQEVRARRELVFFLSDAFSGYKTWNIHMLQNDEAVMKDERAFSMNGCVIVAKITYLVK